jgi:hypothetical protein
MLGFVEKLAAINALADASPGFVWRLKSEEGDATGIRAYDDPLIIVNMSVWATIEDLRNYVYRSAHVEVFRKRKDWFEEMASPSFGLWWLPAGHIPTVDEGKECLNQIEKHGPAPEAFTFRDSFSPPES